MNAESFKIEHEEDGMWMVIQFDEEIPLHTNEGVLRFRIQNCVEALHDAVRADIAPWLRERDEALRTFPLAFYCVPDESGGYDTSDPKHPDFHSIHADIYDNRDKTAGL